MQPNSFMKYFIILLILSQLNIFNACSNRNDTVNCFPNQVIRAEISLNLPQYFTKLNNNGWTYINEQQSGTRGLILVKYGNEFLVFDRNAPHICPDSNTTLEVVNNNKIVCPKDGAEWMINGTPIKISSLPPKNYASSYSSSTGILTIYN